jgi:hypothetical protein
MRTLRLVLVLATMVCLVSCAGDMPVAPRANVEITGVIRDRDGTPLNGAFVYFLVDPEPSEPPYYHLRTQTASDGTFRGVVPAGHYRVSISPRFEQGLPDVEVSFTVSASSTHFEHRYSGVLVSGTAAGPGGAPVAGFSVYAYRTEGYYESISTQATGGAYQILLRPGQYAFEAYSGSSAGGLPRLSFEVNVPDQDTTINIDFGGHEVRFQVTLFGVALPRAYVSVQKPGVSNDLETDLNGEALLYLPSGTYDCQVNTLTQGITRPDRRSVGIQGAATIPIDLSGVRWNGTVRRSADLAPIPHAPVFVQEIGSGRYGSTSTDASGTFEMIVRPGVLHDLWVQPGSGGTYTVNGIASGADSTFDIPINVPVP